jgi:hypothetical protein
MPKKAEQKNYSQLGELELGRISQEANGVDMQRYDAPLTGAKITRMLNQLQFKLQVEEQYKLGIEKMAQAYRAEGDKRLRSETEAKRIESDGKIQLLRKAKKRYETLAKFGGAVEEDEGELASLFDREAELIPRRAYARWQAERRAAETDFWSARCLPPVRSGPQPPSSSAKILQGVQRDHRDCQDRRKPSRYLSSVSERQMA